MDGHTSDINLAASHLCKDHNIILYCFPALAIHLIQPLDVAVYGLLKKSWNDALTAFKRKLKGLQMSRNLFFPTFESTWIKAYNFESNIIAGF